MTKNDLFVDVEKAGGQIEWATSSGIGVRLKRATTCRQFLTQVGKARCRSIIWLCLADTKISDLDVASLVECTSLESLDLSNAAISDESIGTLGQIGTLKEVTLWNSSVTIDARNGLSQRRPDIEIRG